MADAADAERKESGRTSDDRREATELRDIDGSVHHEGSQELGRNIGDINAQTHRAQEIFTRRDAVNSFWRRQVSPTVSHDDSRDHLALERTFLGYLRTGLAFSILGIVIAQLFRLEHTEVPQPFGFFILGIPLACICIGAAVVITLLGAYRFWRQQNAMVRGKVHAGGWELTAVGVTAVVVTFAIFVLIVAVDIEKD